MPSAEGRISLEEPYSREMAALRTDLELGLVESAERNRNAGVERIALFEVARVFLPSGDELPHESWHVAGVAEGGFFRAKGAVETVYRTLGVELELEPGEGRSAETSDGIVRELAGGWGYFELDLDSLFERVPELPALRGRHHLSGGQAGPRVRSRRGGSGGGTHLSGTRGGRRGAARDGRRSTSTAAIRSARDASRSRSASSSARPSALSRTKRPRDCARRSSRPSASVSAPSFGLRACRPVTAGLRGRSAPCPRSPANARAASGSSDP